MRRHEDKIQWPIAEDLVGNRNIAASRVLRLRQIHDGDASRRTKGTRTSEPVASRDHEHHPCGSDARLQGVFANTRATEWCLLRPAARLEDGGLLGEAERLR